MSAEYSGRTPGPDFGNRQKFKLTPEEEEIAAQCYKEAIMSRGLPCSAVTGYLVYRFTRPEVVKNMKAVGGRLPMIAIAAGFGLLGGISSYGGVCLQRLLEVPNSTVKKQLDSVQSEQRNIRTYPPQVLPQKVETDFIQETSTYELNDDYDGYSQGYSSDGPVMMNEEAPAAFRDDVPTIKRKPATYDDLRRRNRDAYMKLPSYQPQTSPDTETQRSENEMSDRMVYEDNAPQY